MNEFEGVSLRKEKLSNQIKEVLKQAILDGKFAPGDKLPPETQLVDLLKVSKVTLREALHEMESEGLIEKRRGIYGGSFVAEPTLDRIQQVMNNFYLFSGLTPEELVEFRQILEPELVAMAVERRTPEDLAAMERNIQEVEAAINKGTPDQAKGIQFHCLIADACHNRLISAIMNALVTIFLEVLSKVPMTLDDARGDLGYNKQFYDCMVHGRSREAKALMYDHFKTLIDIVERSRKDGGQDTGVR